MAIRVLFLLLFALMANGLPRQVDLALTGATLFLSPDTAAIHDGVILISDGKIVAAGRGSRVRGYQAKQARLNSSIVDLSSCAALAARTNFAFIDR